MTSTSRIPSRLPARTPAADRHVLRPGAALMRTAHGWVVRTATGDHFALHVEEPVAAGLLDHLSGSPAGPAPIDLTGVLAALLEAGVVHRAVRRRVEVVGDPADPLVTAIRAALGEQDLDDRSPLPLLVGRPEQAPVGAAGDVEEVHCWIEDAAAWVTPPSVRPRTVLLRHRAVTLHDTTHAAGADDPALAPLPSGPALQGEPAPIGAVGRALVAAHAAALAVRAATGSITGRSAHCATRIDLDRLVVTEHVALPLPPPPG